jgi:hypothetical protein
VETIFIGIASYNEEDLHNSITTAFANAACPENVYVGVALQYPDSETPDLSNFKNVQSVEIHEETGVGLGTARGLSVSFYNNEKYYLQIDAHTIFNPNWDKTLIDNYNLLKTTFEKPIISTYAPFYFKDRVTGQRLTMDGDLKWDVYRKPFTLVTWSNPRAFKKISNTESYYVDAYGINALETPSPAIAEFNELGYEEHYFISGHFLFTSGSFIEEIKYDPMLAYHEENVIAVMAWTRGYRIFNIKDHVLWTRGVNGFSKDFENSWKLKYDKKDKNGVSFHDRVIKGTLRNKDILTGKVLGEWGATTQELLDEYELHANLDYKKFYQSMYEAVERTGNRYHAAKALYDLDMARGSI